MAKHRPVFAEIKGSGFASSTGGFTRLTINGVSHHPDDVAKAVDLFPRMLEALREIVAATQSTVGDASAANRASEIAHSMLAKAEGPTNG